MVNIILLVIISVGVILIIVIVGRNFSKLSSIDTASVPEVRQAALKDKIMIDRLKRKFSDGTKKFILFSQPFYFILKKKIDEIHNKVLEIESSYKKEKEERFLKKGTPKKLRKKIGWLSAKIKELLKGNNLDEVEKKYIEIIKLNPKNIVAYKELGNLYLEQKKYKEAKEIFEYISKIENHKSISYIDLGLVLGIEQDRYISKTLVITPGIRYYQGIKNSATTQNPLSSAYSYSVEFNLGLKYIFLKRN